MVPEKDILRYLHVKALAEQGAPGERDNARRILAKLEKKHAGIAGAASRYQAEKTARAEQASNQHQTPPGVHPSSGSWQAPHNTYGAPNGPHGAGNWENIFSWAQNVAQEVYGFARTVGQAVRGKHLAAHKVKSSVRVSRADNVLITLKMSMETYEEACELNPIQMRAFREALHEKLEDELDSIFWLDDEEAQ